MFLSWEDHVCAVEKTDSDYDFAFPGYNTSAKTISQRHTKYFFHCYGVQHSIAPEEGGHFTAK